MTPQEILKIAHDNIAQRGADRDKGQERSMLAAVTAFNAIFKKDLSETEGWCFMVILKLARASGGAFQIDDYVDAASYAGLAGESAYKAWEAHKKPKQVLIDPNEELQRFKTDQEIKFLDKCLQEGVTPPGYRYDVRTNTLSKLEAD